MIAVVDYGAGNLRSVCNGLDAIGQTYRLANLPADLDGADGILLPGVGHFGQIMGSLRELHFEIRLKDEAVAGKPILGICLGMQSLFESSEEAPGVPGLGLIPGEVVRFADVPRIPHMGWNDVRFRDGGSEAFYFANSYYAPVGEWTTGVSEYGGEFSAAVANQNVCGFQFHPEKSGDAGLKLLKEWCEGC
jgi:imidazole glycerol phosphate synthase glutamine amidotransferase subunit